MISNVLIVNGPVENIAKTGTVTEIVECDGIGSLYKLKEFPTYCGLELYYRREDIVPVKFGGFKVPPKVTKL